MGCVGAIAMIFWGRGIAVLVAGDFSHEMREIVALLRVLRDMK